MVRLKPIKYTAICLFVTSQVNQHHLLFQFEHTGSRVERSVCCPTGWAGPAAEAEKARVDNFVLAQLLASGLIRLTLFLWLFT